jgi:molecular chaperone HtpG
MTEERMQFRAEVSRLLDIVVHSLYSEKEIFLRELISNASDACDKLRYEALTQPELTGDAADYRIKLSIDKKARTLTVSDNGIGMTRDELVGNLGTIARSGTSAFLDQLAVAKDAKKGDVNLIGQFGVGFYAAFMVAQTVEVRSRRAGSVESWNWISDGKGEFTVESGDKSNRGTDVIVYLKQGEDEFLEPERLRHIIGKYSDHIAIPIVIDDEDKPANRASALWMRGKSDVTAEQYKEFYHHVAHAFDDPALTIHWRAEGKLEYAGLLFVPGMKPFDLFDPKRRHGVKLYVKRVFITDDAEGLVPPWLRFLRGVVDSEDLPLNVSREMLQNNPMLAHIKRAVTKRVLGDLIKLADNAEAFGKFWDNFGVVLKEGLYEDAEHRDDLLKLLRVRSTASEGMTSLDDYVSRMKDGQESIFYICGDNAERLARNPHLEGFKARGIEVLLLTDQVDDFWPQAVSAFKGKNFKSATRADEELGKITSDEADQKNESKPEVTGELGSLIALIKLTLGDEVKDVRLSDRLTESPVCLVADEGDLDIHLERFLKQHNQIKTASKRILEINPKHMLITKMASRASLSGASDALGDCIWLLLDQARLIDGEALSDPSAFGRRVNSVLASVVGS